MQVLEAFLALLLVCAFCALSILCEVLCDGLWERLAPDGNNLAAQPGTTVVGLDAEHRL